MTHQEILNKTKAEIDSLCAQAKENLDAIAPKNLEVGKWYKGNVDFDSLVFITEIEKTDSYNRIHGYGFMFDRFNELCHLFSNTDHEKSLVKATPQEVEKALIEEARRRGHTYSEYDYNPEENELCGINDGRLESVFCDGHWEQPVDKFAELKEAHKNGAVIQSRRQGSSEWCIASTPKWFKTHEYRIKPEEKPTIKPRLGRKQERVILDDNNFGHEICAFHEKYKHLAPLVVEFLINNK